MQIYRIVLILFLAISLSACVTSTVKKPNYIPPSHLYSGEEIDVKSPNEPGWFLADTSEGGMQFGRVNTENNESFGAQVLSFPLPATESNEAFVQLIKANVEENTDRKRFTIVESDYKYSDERAYPCVRGESVTIDSKAKISSGRTVKQVLEIAALYCRHPHHPEGGIAIVYSHRGETRMNGFKVRANEFISGVQVPHRSSENVPYK